tara:strand:+ start:309 stop:473 length:165 start_codon:yes stop_codon:yes gene_type:complete
VKEQMKAQELSDSYGWYNHLMLLAGNDILKLEAVVELNHLHAFYNLCHKIESNK